jgi:hypothetical protein
VPGDAIRADASYPGRGDIGAADGALDMTVQNANDAANPRAWLCHSPMATARVDNGDSLPIKVRVTWSLRIN